MQDSSHRDGIVYTETTVHSAPARYVDDAPYQLAIVEVAGGQRITGRLIGKERTERVQIGDFVRFVEERDGVAYYRKDHS